MGEPVDADRRRGRRRARPRVEHRSAALVTGASAGIGRAVRRRRSRVARPRPRARRRATALGSTSSRPELATAHGVAAEVLAADLLDRRGARRRRGAPRATSTRPVDLLVNNAGFGTFGRFAELDVDARGRTRSSSTSSRSCGSPTPRSARWSSGGRGAIINVSSLAAYQPTPGNATYGATKAFVHSFTHAVHEELAGTGVHGDGPVPRLHPHRVPRPRRARLERRPRVPVAAADTVVAAALRDLDRGRVGVVPGTLNQVAGRGRRACPRTASPAASPAWSSSAPAEPAQRDQRHARRR